MSILNVSTGFGLLGFAKVWTSESASRLAGGSTTTRATGDAPTRRPRPAPTPAITHVREPDRFEEDCERWDGLA